MVKCILCGHEVHSRKMRKHPVCKDNMHYHQCQECGAITKIANAYDIDGVENIDKVEKDEDGRYRVFYKGEHDLCKKCQRRKLIEDPKIKNSSKEKTCIICGNKFKPTISVRQNVCNRDHYAICGVCGDKHFISTRKDLNQYKHKYSEFEVVKCDDNECYISYTGNLAEIACNVCKHSNEEVVSFMKEEQQSSFKETCLEKYGVENVSASEEVEAKRVATYQKHYGVKHPMKIKEVAEERGKKVSESRREGFASGRIKPSNKSNNIKGKHCTLIVDGDKKKFRSIWEFLFALLLEIKGIDY